MNKSQKIFLLAVVFFINSESIFSQNLDFELHSEDLMPVGWVVNKMDQKVKVDEKNHFTGDFSLHFLSSKEKSFSSVFQVEEINEQFPKKFKISACVKSEETDGMIVMWCRVDGVNEQLVLKNAVLKSTQDTIEWKLLELDIEIPPNGVSISYGVFIRGKVNAWVDNFQIRPSISEDESSDMKENFNLSQARTFDIGNSMSVAESLKSMAVKFENTKVVALGENTHGAKEIFELKAEIFKYLFENHDYKVLAIEYSLPETFAINKRLSNPDLSVKEILRDMYFWVYYCEEFVDLLEWARMERLKTNSPYPKIVGFDMQYYQAALGFVNSYLADINCLDCSTTLREINHKISALRKSKDEQNLEELKKLTVQLTKYLAKVDDNSDQFEKSTEFIEKNINTIYQSLNKKNELYRDSLMYENVKWWMDKQNEKMVIWAHNNHIRENSHSMGDRLNSFLGDQSYLTIGFLFKDGAFRGKSKKGHMNNYNVSAPLKGSYEQLFSSRLPGQDFLINLENIHQAGNTRHKQNFYREIGAFPVEQEYFFNNLSDDFDNIIFLQKITPTKPFSSTE